MLRALVMITGVLCCFGLVALAQPTAQPDKKANGGKQKPASVPSKGKNGEKTTPPGKATQPGKEAPKAKTSIDQLPLPKDALIVIVEDLQKASELIPTGMYMTLEAHRILMERLKVLENQVKTEKKIPGLCKLTGKLEGEFLLFRAEFGFFTKHPRTPIHLGLRGCFLMDEGDLDGETPILESTKDDQIVVIVEKPGDRHRLTLNFRVPAPVKKTGGGAIEREVKLDLPGSAATPLTLELPTNIKELVWNDNLEKPRTPGHWNLGLGTAKAISLSWKESAPLSGNAALPKVDGQIKVDVDPTHVRINAELFLEDSRLQTTKWRLLLPEQVKIDDVKVKAPGGLTYTWNQPDKEKPFYILETSGATAERWQIKLAFHLARPNPGVRLPIGPFLVLGAFQQTGSITVTMPTKYSFGQRLVPTQNGEVYQVTNSETELTFKYVTPTVSDKNLKGALALKAPLELEWRAEKSQLSSKVDHSFKVQTNPQGWEIEVISRIQLKALYSTIQAVDIMLPAPRQRGLAGVGTALPALGFPGAIPWAGLWKTLGVPWADGIPETYAVFDEQGTALKPLSHDTVSKARFVLDRNEPTQTTLVVRNVFRVPAYAQRIRLELPRPLNTQDRGAKVSVQSDDRIELLFGPEGGEEPVPYRHRFEVNLDQTPVFLDLAWRPYRREITAQSTLDIQVHEQTAEVIQSLQLSKDGVTLNPNTKSYQVACAIPLEVQNVWILSGGEIIQHDRVRQTLLIRPELKKDRADLRFRYDVAVTDRKMTIVPLRPINVSHQDVKVRVWAESGMTPTLVNDVAQRSLWKERSIEAIAGKDQFPALVLQGFGPSLPLTLTLSEAATVPLAAFIATRALIQARMLDDASQQCRALYLVRKIHGVHVDIELPMPAALLNDGPTISIGKVMLNRIEKIDASGKVIRVRLHPDQVSLPAVLEIRYTVPADAMEWNSFWRTTLYAPVFRSEVVIEEMRWQLTSPRPMLAASLGRHSRPLVQWSLQNWLPTPENALSTGQLEAWVGAKESLPVGAASVYSFAELATTTETVYHLPRELWLLGCSGIFLILTLGAFYVPLSRRVLGVGFVLVGIALAALAIFWPGVVPPIVFGLQPGVFLFAIFIAGHWLVQERYRRQLVFLTGFTRTKPGSTMVRTGPDKRPRDVSTVDEPGVVPADVEKSAGSQAGS